MSTNVKDRLRCAYEDCAEAHPLANESTYEQVTCPTCRAALGLPPVEIYKNSDETVAATPKPRAGEHTKGPWRVDMDSPFIIAAGNGYSVCETTPGNPYDISNEQAQANARRIVAAVNACDGISIGELEALAKMGIKDYANILAKSSHDMEAERDFLVAQIRELREALEGILAAADSSLGIWTPMIEPFKVARDLLAKAHSQ